MQVARLKSIDVDKLTAVFRKELEQFSESEAKVNLAVITFRSTINLFVNRICIAMGAYDHYKSNPIEAAAFDDSPDVHRIMRLFETSTAGARLGGLLHLTVDNDYYTELRNLKVNKDNDRYYGDAYSSDIDIRLAAPIASMRLVDTLTYLLTDSSFSNFTQDRHRLFEQQPEGIRYTPNVMGLDFQNLISAGKDLAHREFDHLLYILNRINQGVNSLNAAMDYVNNLK